MSLEVIQTLQTELETSLSNQGVKVFFSRMLGEDYGRYLDNGTIFINYQLQGNDEEILKVTAHEAVHHLQLTKGILIGDSSPHHWNPELTKEQSQLLEEIVKSQYDPEDWKWELPAWSLQYAPRKVLELLRT
jgi:hypothetical protein